MDNVIKEAAGSLYLDAGRRSVIVANAVNGLCNERVKGLIIGHEFASLPFASVDSRADDGSRVQDRTGLEGSDRRHEFGDGEGFARQEGLAQDKIRDGEERAWSIRGKEGAIEGERGGVRVREGCRGTWGRGITRRGDTINHRSRKGRRG